MEPLDCNYPSPGYLHRCSYWHCGRSGHYVCRTPVLLPFSELLNPDSHLTRTLPEGLCLEDLAVRLDECDYGIYDPLNFSRFEFIATTVFTSCDGSNRGDTILRTCLVRE